MVTINLSEEDARLFLEFQKNYETFTVLEQSGVFNIRNGKAVLNFDQSGVLHDVECTMKLYKRGVPSIPVLVALA